MLKRQKNRVKEEGEISGSKLSRRGRKIKCHKCSMVGHNSRSCQNSTTISSIPPLARVPLVAPAPPAAAALAPPTPSQTVASKASASSPLAP
ncbi:hypothetical protein PVK06_009019 [Gossypium arboreum]|uniref:CCHC-type domain-containing protein n=1 Tax=Gossypium arboreum TaxID=29729 RepID=A0ABR0QMC5_GOSAR|nr:hypothetical protein PVK06_009019 [Gossypium arboreum]